MASSTPSRAIAATQTFHPFTRLPYELRHIIYAYILKPRIFLLQHTSPQPSGTEVRPRHHQAPPPLLHVCHESRAFALQHYTLHHTRSGYNLTPFSFYYTSQDVIGIADTYADQTFVEPSSRLISTFLGSNLRPVLTTLLLYNEYNHLGYLDLDNGFTIKIWDNVLWWPKVETLCVMIGVSNIERFVREGGCAELVDVAEHDYEWDEVEWLKSELKRRNAYEELKHTGRKLEIRFARPVWDKPDASLG